MSHGFIDLHMHILPEMDDGAMDLDEAMEMAAVAAARGTSVIACTSHANGPRSKPGLDKEDFICSCEDLQWELDQAGIPIHLVPGMEIYFELDTLERIRAGELIPLGKSNYYLIEFPFEEKAERMLEAVRSLREAGYRLIIAHPERYYCIQDDAGLVAELIAAGALFQCNGKSLIGQFGKAAEKAAKRMLANGQYACIGSDSHGMRRRTPDLLGVYRYLVDTGGTDFADRLMKENPHKILNNGIIK